MVAAVAKAEVVVIEIKVISLLYLIYLLLPGVIGVTVVKVILLFLIYLLLPGVIAVTVVKVISLLFLIYLLLPGVIVAYNAVHVFIMQLQRKLYKCRDSLT